MRKVHPSTFIKTYTLYRQTHQASDIIKSLLNQLSGAVRASITWVLSSVVKHHAQNFVCLPTSLKATVVLVACLAAEHISAESALKYALIVARLMKT